MTKEIHIIEQHPLLPFLPKTAKVLMLGSFPPPQHRWKMNFYYPNFQNDMWRILGYVFFNDKDYFIDVNRKTFNENKIKHFLENQGIAIYDAAEKIRRLQQNASDKHLEVIQPTDLKKLLIYLPQCKHIVTTGEKATQLVLKYFNNDSISAKVGSTHDLTLHGKHLYLHRLPSSSRAYPLPLFEKAQIYKHCFAKIFSD